MENLKSVVFIDLEKELTLEQGEVGQDLYLEYNQTMLEIVNSNDLRNFVDNEVNSYIQNEKKPLNADEEEKLRAQFATKYVMEKPFERLMKLQQFKMRSKMFGLRSKILALISHFKDDKNSLSNYDVMLDFWKQTPMLVTENYNGKVQEFINFFTKFITEDSAISDQEKPSPTRSQKSNLKLIEKKE